MKEYIQDDLRYPIACEGCGWSSATAWGLQWVNTHGFICAVCYKFGKRQGDRQGMLFV